MDDFIAIYFTVSPQISAIRYHKPETLEPFDYMFHFRGVREGRRPNGVPYIERVTRSAARHRLSRARGSTSTFAIDAAPGLIAGVGADTDAGFALRVGGEPKVEPQRVRLI